MAICYKRDLTVPRILYYDGNIEEDLKSFSELISFNMFVYPLKDYGRTIGFGRMQQLIRQSEPPQVSLAEGPILENLRYLEKQWGADTLCKVIQVLWAQYLSEIEGPTIGALYYGPVE